MTAVKVHASKEMSHSVDRVWALISDFGNLSWMSAGGMEFKMTTTGSGLGMVRHIDVPGIIKIDERLDLLDESMRRLGYTIPKNTVLPFDDYRVIIALSETDSGGTRVDWNVRFDSAEMDAGEAEKMIGETYAQHGDWIDAALSATG